MMGALIYADDVPRMCFNGRRAGTSDGIPIVMLLSIRRTRTGTEN